LLGEADSTEYDGVFENMRRAFGHSRWLVNLFKWLLISARLCLPSYRALFEHTEGSTNKAMHAEHAIGRFFTWWLYSRVPGDGRRSSVKTVVDFHAWNACVRHRLYESITTNGRQS
jgi:hypothetical protein